MDKNYKLIVRMVPSVGREVLCQTTVIYKDINLRDLKPMTNDYGYIIFNIKDKNNYNTEYVINKKDVNTFYSGAIVYEMNILTFWHVLINKGLGDQPRDYKIKRELDRAHTKDEDLAAFSEQPLYGWGDGEGNGARSSPDWSPSLRNKIFFIFENIDWITIRLLFLFKDKILNGPLVKDRHILNKVSVELTQFLIYLNENSLLDNKIIVERPQDFNMLKKYTYKEKSERFKIGDYNNIRNEKEWEIFHYNYTINLYLFKELINWYKRVIIEKKWKEKKI